MELVRELPYAELSDLLEHYSAVAGQFRVVRMQLLSMEDQLAEMGVLVEWQRQALAHATLERERARATRSELDGRVRVLELAVEQLRLRGAAGEAAKSALGLAVGLLKELVPHDLRARKLSLLAMQIGVGLSVPIRTGPLGPRPGGTEGPASAVVLPFPGRRPADTSKEADIPRRMNEAQAAVGLDAQLVRRGRAGDMRGGVLSQAGHGPGAQRSPNPCRLRTWPGRARPGPAPEGAAPQPSAPDSGRGEPNGRVRNTSAVFCGLDGIWPGCAGN